ncbi:MAG: GntR family transcriptional regulator [Kiritimatiellaeota bacterium]|nr:GntR family transcriptional regulator [Kiritimatiellota bacterium]
MVKRIGVDHICAELRHRLKSGELKPESRIVEQELAEGFGVSRTPIRAAIERLRAEGLFVGLPNLGTFVRRFSMGDVRDTFEIREVLEGLAFRGAAERFSPSEREELLNLGRKTDAERSAGNWKVAFKLDEEFHAFIMERCGSEMLKKELGKFNFQSSLIQADLSVVSPRVKRKRITVTHVELAEASDDPERAENLMREHIAGLKRWLFQ